MRKQLADDDLVHMLDRATICVASAEPGIAAHRGDDCFREIIQQHYSVAENNALEQLVELKGELRDASTDDFWRILMDGMVST